MSNATDNSNLLGESPAVDIIGKIMVVIIIVLFMVVVSFLFIHLFAKGFWWSQRRQSQSDNNRQRGGRRSHHGLDASVIKSLPVSVFNSKDENVECSVCLSEVVEGEKLRVLPQCNHKFHIYCIDMWFQSHSTCPLCRITLATPSSSSSTLVVQQVEQEQESPAPAFPTNVLIWGGNHNQVISSTTLEHNISSSSSNIHNNSNNNTRDVDGNGMLRIDIPSDCDCDATASSSSPLGTGGGGRLSSLKRLLSSRALSSLNPWSPTSSSSSTTHVQQQTKPKEASGQT
ncbi:RING-H2 finger protein ATL2 [Trifolium repens]|nr:RING-H2 finger protein ATL2 [Trifolium repens]